MSNIRKALALYGRENATKILVRDAVDAIAHIHAKWSEFQGNEFKYLNIDEWMPKYAYIAQALRLHKDFGLKILDLGAGPGWMSWVAKKLGHYPEALDLPDARPVYGEMCEALGVPVTPHRISPHKPLAVGKGYSVAIALMSSFYLYRHEWNAAAFDYLLFDLEARMTPRNVILFELNHAAGQFLLLDIFDVFSKHGYRMCDNFVFKISGYPSEEERFIYNAISRYHRVSRYPWRGIWRYASTECLKSNPGIYIDRLLEDFSDDTNLLAQKGIFHVFVGNTEKAISCLEENPDPAHTGVAVCLAQLYLAKGDRVGALRAIRKLLAVKPNNAIAKEWVALLSHSIECPVYEASEYWQHLYCFLDNNPNFERIRSALPYAATADPVSWYLRCGTVCWRSLDGFVPLTYWGEHNDVFLSGMDPLVHFLAGYKGNYSN